MKRLVICCDGTWNYADQSKGGEATPTNVTQVHRAVAPVDSHGVTQVPTYHPGVGTERFERLRGGLGGYGLSKHVRNVYTFVVENFEPGDEIFLFGFSRGAYTARSTVGLIRACGVLPRHEKGRVDEAYGLYRGATDDDGKDKARQFRERYSRETPVTFLGVWDTVGALGIPLSGTRFFNVINRRYRFHSVDLSSMVQAAYQALAVDERRGPFEPAIWKQTPTAQTSAQVLEQVWFAGVHSDVGGGYADSRLADLALHWMATRAAGHGLELTGLPQVVPDDDTAVRSELHDSFKGFYRALKPHRRRIGMTDPAHESAASTAVTRLRSPGGGGVEKYDAANLAAYLDGEHLITEI